MTETVERSNVSYGDREVAEAHEILRTTVGSGLHGIAIAGTDDNDEMGIFIPPPQYVLGVSRHWPDGHSADQYVGRTKPEGVRSGAGDTDLTIYALRKYLGLAAAGNPTVLLPLFAPPSAVLKITPEGRALRSHAGLFPSLQAGRRFLGYLHQQRERMLGLGRQSRVPNRPEIVAKHGYDTKYASHAMRLAYQGIEIVTQQRLILPMAQHKREEVLAVRRGELSQETVIDDIARLEDQLQRLIARNPVGLREYPDWDAINALAVHLHTKHWGSVVV